MDSFLLGHETLGRLRADLNFEADCSDNGHNGTWSGSGIAGSQYITNGWRLSTGTFNGSDWIQLEKFWGIGNESRATEFVSEFNRLTSNQP